MVDPAFESTATTDFAALARIAERIARQVGDRILELRAQGVEVAATKSSIVDVVTQADQEAERLLTEALQDARPDDGILGEEGASVTGTTDITWVIDPIDGTVNYLYDLAAYSVSIAATVRDATATSDGRRAVAGAVYCPRTAEMFTAFEGGGSALNGTPLAVTEKHELATALVATGFGYTVERRQEQLEVLARLLPRIRDIRRMGSAAYDLCSLAAGRLDAYYEIGLQPWDYAAGALIAREAGATLRGIDEASPPGTPLLIAANPWLADELHRIVT